MPTVDIILDLQYVVSMKIVFFDFGRKHYNFLYVNINLSLFEKWIYVIKQKHVLE